MDLEKFKHLPASAALPQIRDAVKSRCGCIFRAAPGAGKTMLVPVALSEMFPGKILLMEPRRIAAKNAAAGICKMQGWQLGREAGFMVRQESCCSPDSRIVAATCGVVLNMLQEDPGLSGYDAVIFDEFHERSAEQELIFALLREVRSALREDLAVVIMSATLDEALADMLPEFPEVSAPGREFPVEISYRKISGDFYQLPGETAKAVVAVWREYSGDMLVFLPGKGEIDRCAALLEGALPDGEVLKLHGNLTLNEQSRVLSPGVPGKRRVILSTNIAESSLTVEGVTAVIDSGWERRMRFAPGMGMPVLEPCRISVDSAVQRSGRAGRCAPGRAVRLWSVQEELGFRSRGVPEILECDFARTVLELARWGCRFDQLEWLTPPPEANVAVAVKTVQGLGLMDQDGMLTADGIQAVKLPVHPRFGAMLQYAGKHGMLPLAAEIAALTGENLRRRDDDADIRELILEFRRNKKRFPQVSQSCERILSAFKCAYIEQDCEAAGILIARAYPEYVGRARSRHGIIYQLAGGRSARLKEQDLLRKEEFLAVADLAVVVGSEAAVRLAAPLDKEDINTLFAGQITREVESSFDSDSGRLKSFEVSRFGSMVLESRPVPADPATAGIAVLKEALRRQIELPESGSAAARFLERIRFARRSGDESWPDWEAEKFPAVLQELAAPFLNGVRNFDSLKALPWLNILESAFEYPVREALDRFFPDKFRTPSGREFFIDYSGEQPTLSVPIQQLYGVHQHPCVGKNKLPLRLMLLSPARRPVQITCDLPGFWDGNWSLVRSEMRSRYPKHDWPEHP